MKKIIFLFALLIRFGSSYSQTTANSNGQAVSLQIPAVALLKLSGTGSTFQFNTPTAGENFVDATSTGTSLQYTSIMTTNLERAIYVSATGTSTKGFNLSVIATQNNTTNSNGQLGMSTNVPSYIFVSSQTAAVVPYTGTNTFNAIAGNFNVKLISGISSGYTGSLATDGPKLTYTASVGTAGGGPAIVSADYAALRSGTYTFQVYYTMSENI